jgi:hypothetical protein
MNSLRFDASIDPVQHDQLRASAGRHDPRQVLQIGKKGKHVLPWERNLGSPTKSTN